MNNAGQIIPRMLNKRTLWISLVIFLATYTLLMLPETRANQFYCKALCQIGNKLYQNFSHGGYVRFSPQTDKGKNDIALFISRSDWKQGGKLIGATTDKASDRIGFLITAFFTALMLATPMSWKRKLFAVPAGLIILTAFVLLKLRIIILHAYTQVPIFDLYQEEVAKQSIGWWYHHMAANATMGYSVALIIWIAFSFNTITGIKKG